jgi:hypothetical protein
MRYDNKINDFETAQLLKIMLGLVDTITITTTIPPPLPPLHRHSQNPLHHQQQRRTSKSIFNNNNNNSSNNNNSDCIILRTNNNNNNVPIDLLHMFLFEDDREGYTHLMRLARMGYSQSIQILLSYCEQQLTTLLSNTTNNNNNNNNNNGEDPNNNRNQQLIRIYENYPKRINRLQETAEMIARKYNNNHQISVVEIILVHMEKIDTMIQNFHQRKDEDDIDIAVVTDVDNNNNNNNEDSP